MWLIDTTTLELEEFSHDEKLREYAVLSHRWGKEEVSHQDYLDGRKRDGEGFTKIRAFCALAASHGHKWAWVDTCCIDKKSSAELSESINSMFNYYKGAAMCYAYLVDVTAPELRDSEWFSRGWTLQELLAPWEVLFFNNSWQQIGKKRECKEQLATITGIPAKCLISSLAREEASVAQKMSWAAQRKSTRTEDVAYCLLGLFDVNMPLLYGEGGEKAFMRLQLEIIRKSDDESIFAWIDDNRLISGMLAHSPEAFRDSGNILRADFDESMPIALASISAPYSMTNKGLQICKALYPADNINMFQEPGTHAIVLNCVRCDEATGRRFLSVLLHRRHARSGWVRVRCDRLLKIGETFTVENKTEPETLFVLDV